MQVYRLLYILLFLRRYEEQVKVKLTALTTTRLHILIIYPSELASTFFISIIHHYHHRRSNVNRDKNNKVLFKGREKTKQKSHIDNQFGTREHREQASKQASFTSTSIITYLR